MSRGPLLAMPVDASGSIDLKGEEPEISWREDRAGPGFASPLVHEGLVYVLGSNGSPIHVLSLDDPTAPLDTSCVDEIPPVDFVVPD